MKYNVTRGSRVKAFLTLMGDLKLRLARRTELTHKYSLWPNSKFTPRPHALVAIREDLICKQYDETSTWPISEQLERFTIKPK